MSSKAMSLKGKIKNYAKSKSIAAQVVLQNYMFERFLARLSMSDYREKFVVKGGMLIAAIVGLDTRSTMDLDTTLRNLPLTEEKVMEAVENICKITLGDDVIFEVKSIAPIRKDDRYGGFCVRLDAIYDTIVTPLSIDVSTGDVITPEAVEYEFSGIFDEEIRIKMWGYNIESVMAEKVETILSRGIFNTRPRDFQTKADAVFFSSKYGRTKAVKTKILAGVVTTVMIYCMGITLLSVICFGIMGTSGMNTPYQMYQAYSIYIMSYGQYYLLTVVCGFIASMLAAVVSMLVAAKMHTISVAVCIPFFLYCLLPFIGRALSGYTTLFNLIPTILTNVQASVKVPLIYQIGNCVFRQIPLVMVMYTVMAIALLPFIYKSFRRYGNK